MCPGKGDDDSWEKVDSHEREGITRQDPRWRMLAGYMLVVMRGRGEFGRIGNWLKAYERLGRPHD